MTHPTARLRLGDAFNTFLFAIIGENQHGLPLSVVSMLARANLDPWQKAAELSRLPAATATQQLTSLLGALQELSLKQADTDTLAARLIDLLPRGTVANARPPVLSLAARAALQPRFKMQAIFIALSMSR